jgi:uncharacterized membrane protein
MEVIMARADQKAKTGEIESQSACLRCGGLMVNDVSMDLMNSTGELDCVTTRCVQCGDILDPVIWRHRRIRQEAMTVQRAGQSLPNNRAMQFR